MKSTVLLIAPFLLCGVPLHGVIGLLSDNAKRLLIKDEHPHACPKRPLDDHGHYKCPSASPHRGGQTCNLICDSGYKVHGHPATAICHDTKWTKTAHCVEIFCPPPKILIRGHQTCTKKVDGKQLYRVGAVCTATCVDGFRETYSLIRCTDGSWSHNNSCHAIGCDKPTVQHGTVHCSGKPLIPGSTCTVSCPSGYRASSTKVTCLSSYKWTASLNCVEIICPTPPSVSNGVYRCSSNKENSVCQLSCNPDFRPSSSHSSITCLSSSTWSTPATCVQTPCPHPPAVAHGTFQCSSSTVHSPGSTCSLTCSTGYKPSNSYTTITCLLTAKWSTSATCIREVRCPYPPRDPHGVYHCTSYQHKLNDVCQLRCSSGYKPSTTDSDIKCLSTERWSQSAQCVKKSCADPPMVMNGTYVCNQTTKSTCQLQCDPGFEAENISSTITCLDNETWSSPSACAEITCPAPPVVPHGVYQCTTLDLTYNTECNLQCDSGYQQNGSQSDITCQSSGNWSSPGECVVAPCPEPPVLDHGSFQCSSRTVHNPGSTCSLTCADGFTPSNSYTTITCLASSTWSTSASCIGGLPAHITCPDPPQVDHGTYTCSSSSYKLGDVCQLNCSPGYEMGSGSFEIICMDPGSWSAPNSCTVQGSIGMDTAKITSMPSMMQMSTPSPLDCEICSGGLCGFFPGNDPMTKCPSDKPFCLNHVDNDDTGKKTVTKSCASADECNRRWWHETSDKSSCVDFDPTIIYKYQLSCSYCCTKPGCNKDIVPKKNTLFIGHE